MLPRMNSCLSLISSVPRQETHSTSRHFTIIQCCVIIYLAHVGSLCFRIFGRTLSIILEHLENYLLNCHDAIGLLLMIKITHFQRLVMQRRRVPVLDAFFDRISLLLWPRLKNILDANLKSLKAANPRKLGPVDLTPHYISRRYAEFVASILTLQQQSGSAINNSSSSGGATPADAMGIGGGGDNMLQHDLSQLKSEMISLLEKLAALLPNPKERRVFFINNYDLVSLPQWWLGIRD
jgi:hypothetical protein